MFKSISVIFSPTVITCFLGVILLQLWKQIITVGEKELLIFPWLFIHAKDSNEEEMRQYHEYIIRLWVSVWNSAVWWGISVVVIKKFSLLRSFFFGSECVDSCSHVHSSTASFHNWAIGWMTTEFGFSFWWAKHFSLFHNMQISSEVHHSPLQWTVGITWLGHEANLSSTSSVTVKYAWSYTYVSSRPGFHLSMGSTLLLPFLH
jgi:hypothetical protein